MSFTCDTLNYQRPSDDIYDSAILNAQIVEIKTLLSRINQDALAKRASLLRNLSCMIIPADLNNLSTMMGDVNLHLELQFSDNVRWIARIKRQNVTTPLKSVQNLVIESEVATYRFLQNTQVPAPLVFDFCANSDNAVGVPYILMEKVPGRPFSKCVPTVEQRYRVMKQIAFIYKELYRYPFEIMGSLHLQDSEPRYFVGSLASELLSDSDSSDNIESLKTLGPFQDSAHYYEEIIARILSMIVDGVLYTSWLRETYLIHLSLHELSSSNSISQSLSSSGNGKFYLKHPDDQGTHIMIDENYNITGIIDWEWAFTTPATIAFTSPMMLWNYMEKGKMIQRFNFIMGNEISDWDISSYIENFSTLLRIQSWDFDSNGWVSWDEWKLIALEKFKDDEGLQKLILKEC
ncbi:hypothetical protein SS1G_12916 [Sclerotinia sclerotiorum 1980 UF-70]|uniref:Aminoglycoside phosphotransferase domain-containing protein n=1 Tax=Sclerotinia sclerotiorum (strain ATCC 18683 / 1980 / Ss-1) TaxID=665079 RepID=A7F5N8_SCLS1|nr:hypothetical protein SS1G_12916 [Sclerotinia sclerotiorum 1980 UF-70]EDN98059.1 hypothetical protein SS1G_12916 [Sclerotinia sclerotiorum 1980 UF-70]